MIDAKCTTDNLYALKSNADVDAFRRQQIQAIDAKVVPDENPGGGETKTPPAPKKIKHLSAKDICRAQRITSIDELNSYIDSIRRNLIAALDGNDEIRVS